MSIGHLYVLFGEVSIQILFKFFEVSPCCFPQWLHQPAIPTNSAKEFPFLHILDIKLKSFYIAKEIINKIKSFCNAEENIRKMKREPSVWENTFPNDTSDKGLISKIDKEITWLHSQKTNNPIKKMGKGLEQMLLQGGHTECPDIWKDVQHH